MAAVEFEIKQFPLLSEELKVKMFTYFACIRREGKHLPPELTEKICAEMNASGQRIDEHTCLTCGFHYPSNKVCYAYETGDCYWSHPVLERTIIPKKRAMWQRFISAAWGCCTRCIKTVYNRNKEEIDPLLPDFPRRERDLNAIIGWVVHITQLHHRTNTISDILAMSEVQEVVRAIAPYVRAAGTAKKVVRSEKPPHIYRNREYRMWEDYRRL